MKRLTLALCLAAQLSTFSMVFSTTAYADRGQITARGVCQALWNNFWSRRALIVAGAYVLFSTIDPVSMTNEPPATNTISLSKIDIKEVVVTSQDKSIRGNWFGYYGHGFMIGQVSRSRPGHPYVVLGSLELEVNQGVFAGTNYIGHITPLSTTIKPIYEKFQSLDRSSTFVFEYIHKNALNAELPEENLQVIGIYTPEEFLASRGITSLPREVRAADQFWGWKTRGSTTAQETGRIVGVERLGIVDSFCRVEFNRGGSRQDKEGGGGGLQAYNVLDEEVCKFAEAAMALSRDVQVDYEQDYMEYWQPSYYYINNIRIPKKSSGGSPRLTPEEIQQIKEHLKNDPQFIQEVKAQILTSEFRTQLKQEFAQDPELMQQIVKAASNNPELRRQLREQIFGDLVGNKELLQEIAKQALEASPK